MPLAPTDNLTPHFTAFELGADKPEADAIIVANLWRTATYLETVRSILGVRLQVNTPSHRNRGFRTPDANISVGGAATSSHTDGKAADVVPLDGMTLRLAFDLLTAADAAGKLPPFDQIIYYPASGYIHIGLGSQMRREVRIYLAEISEGTKYPFLTSDLVQRLGGNVAAAVLAIPFWIYLVVFALVIVALTDNRKG